MATDEMKNEMGCCGKEHALDEPCEDPIVAVHREFVAKNSPRAELAKVTEKKIERRERIIQRDVSDSLNACGTIQYALRDKSQRARALTIAFFLAEFDPVAAGKLYATANMLLNHEVLDGNEE